MLLTQRAYVFVPCPMHQVLKPTVKLAHDTGEIRSTRLDINKGLIQEINIYQSSKQNKYAPKCPFGVLVCRHATVA